MRYGERSLLLRVPAEAAAGDCAVHVVPARASSDQAVRRGDLTARESPADQLTHPGGFGRIGLIHPLRPPDLEPMQGAMAPRTFKQIAGTLAALILLVLISPWKEQDESAPADARVVEVTPGAAPAGFYPPAPSKAVGMTPEWREFADAVDRICATSYNEALGIEAQVDHAAKARGWSDGRAEAARLGVWNNQASTILHSTDKLGQPPERPELFSRWRANVGQRAVLREQAAQAAARGRWGAYRGFINRIYPLKDRSDEIGQRFGLRICTSN